MSEALVKWLAPVRYSAVMNRSGLKRHEGEHPDALPPAQSKPRSSYPDGGWPLLISVLLVHLFRLSRQLKQWPWTGLWEGLSILRCLFGLDLPFGAAWDHQTGVAIWTDLAGGCCCEAGPNGLLDRTLNASNFFLVICKFFP